MSETKKKTDNPEGFGQGEKDEPKKHVAADERVERVAPLSSDDLGTPDTQPDQPREELMEHQFTRKTEVDKENPYEVKAAEALKEHEKLD